MPLERQCMPQSQRPCPSDAGPSQQILGRGCGSHTPHSSPAREASSAVLKTTPREVSFDGHTHPILQIGKLRLRESKPGLPVPPS